MSSKKYTVLIILALMLLVLLLFTLPLWGSSNLIYQGDIYNSDTTELNFPARKYLSDCLKDGGIPFWNPYIGDGFPVVAEGQSGVFYPLNLLLFGLLSPVLAYNLSLIISLLLALAFSYLLLRHYQASRPAALFAAVAFAFSGFIMAKLKFTYMINAICWLPLAIYGLEKAFSSKNLKYLLLSTLALAMQVLAGGSQIFLITLSAMLIIAAWRLLPLLLNRNGWEVKRKRRLFLVLLLGFVMCVLLSLTFAAPQLIPQLSAFPSFNRSTDLPFSWSVGRPMRPKHLTLFVSPYQYGNPAHATYNLEMDFFWEDVGYAGLLTLVLALVAVLFLWKKDHDIKLWLLIGVLALTISLSTSTPLARWLFEYVPGFSMFRFWQRFLVLTVLAVAVMAAKGLDHIFAFFRSGKIWYGSIIALVFIVLLVDLGLFTYSQISTIDSERLLEPNQTVEWLEDNMDWTEYRIATLGEDEAWEEAYSQSLGWMGEKDLYFEYLRILPPNYNNNFDVPGVSQYGAYGLTPIKEFWILTFYGHVRDSGWNTRVPDSVINILAMQSAQYIITPYILDNQGLTMREKIPTDIRGMDYYIYEIEAAMPRAFMTTKYEVVEDMDALTNSQIAELFWNSEEVEGRVLLNEEPQIDLPPESQGEAKIISSSKDKVVVEADSTQGGILVLNDAYFKEWQVFVDGERAEMLEANIAFRAVELGPGKHTVEFVNRPVSFYYGLAIFAAGVLLLLLILLQNRKSGFLEIKPDGGEGPEVPELADRDTSNID